MSVSVACWPALLWLLGWCSYVSWVDGRTLGIPVMGYQAVLWSGLICHALVWPGQAATAILGVVVGYVLLAWVNPVLARWRGRHVMGEGDPCWLAALGGWCGPQGICQALTVGSAVLLVVGGARLLLEARRTKQGWWSVLQQPQPFAPALSLGGLLVYVLQGCGP